MAADHPTELDRLADDEDVRSEYDRLVAAQVARLFELDELDEVIADADRSTVSVTGLVTYAQCPKRFFWTNVDPLPRKRNTAALRGSEVHRRIELHQLGQVPFEEFSEDLYDDLVRDGDSVGAYEAYEKSRFAQSRASLVEAPFTVTLDNGYQVRGRIDAIYADGRRWEIVDFKSGRRKDDPARLVQLQAYAVAADEVDFALDGPDELDVTFAYLGGGVDEHTERADRTWVEDARATLMTLTDRIESGDFDPAPGTWCETCDFLQFCEPGQMELRN